MLPWLVSSLVTLECRLPGSNERLAELIDRYSTLLNDVISVVIYTLKERAGNLRDLK